MQVACFHFMLEKNEAQTLSQVPLTQTPHMLVSLSALVLTSLHTLGVWEFTKIDLHITH